MKKIMASLLLFTAVFGWTQEPVKWIHVLKKIDATTYEIQHLATIDSTWHLYSQYSNPEGAIPTEILYEGVSQTLQLDGPTQESKSITAFDTVFEMDLTYFEEQAQFTQQFSILDPNTDRIEGEIAYQACDDKLCIFRTESFALSLAGEAILPTEPLALDSQNKADALRLTLSNSELLAGQLTDEANPFYRLFLLGLLGGLLALLTPCVFPMIPLTVSFFIKQQQNPSKGTFQALLYGFFIVLIYALLSLPFHLLDNLNPEILNTLSTNIVLNVVFFGVFVIFAFSFFGFFELTLPSHWGTRSDKASQWQGVLGIFFMAVTLAIVSFSCTGPILGSLLAGSLSGSSGAIQLTFGMLGFGVALAFPFAFFALFPKWLQALPRSGGWMTTVKVTLGFLELALALKFLSNADLVAHWGLLKRELFIGIWVLLAFGLTLYLFGIYRFPHELKKPLSRGRKIVAGLALLGTSYLFLGLLSSENRLTLLSGFPPPEFYSFRQQDSDCPLGLDCYKDFESGRAAAQMANKPILLDFTGWACVNCRKMEENVWSDPQVFALLKEKFVLISLYVDDREPLPEDEQFSLPNSNGTSRKIDTVGEKWAAFQALNFQSASQPFYVLLSPAGRVLAPSIQYTDTTTFQQWLTSGWDAFND
ncbi:MAG: protein-disulfide reductase DsbD family protein [Flavobacteriaceae bacterium]